MKTRAVFWWCVETVSQCLISLAELVHAQRTPIFQSALITIALSSFALPGAQAATYTVNTSSDSVVANACENHQSGCSLRGAILAANAHNGDTIVFSIIEFCGINGCVINLLSPLPDISAPMSISGPSRHAIQRSPSAATNFRVFNVTTTGTVNISDLTIKQGKSGQREWRRSAKFR